MSLFVGCGTTKWSDTSRTATEQLLITSAMDAVVDEFNFYPLSGRKVYINKTGINCSDSQYLISILRQQLAANGVLVKDKEDEADYILEIAPGAAGTNRYDLMYGIPKTEIPSIATGGTVSAIPELALIKRTDQKAQVKIMLWAYNKKSGAIIWQSGNKTKTAEIRNRWILGFGPITKASYNKKIQVGGDDVDVPRGMTIGQTDYRRKDEKPSVQTEAIYCEIDQRSIDHLATIRAEGRYRLQNDDANARTQATDEKKKKDADADTLAKGKDKKDAPVVKDAPKDQKPPDSEKAPGTPPAGAVQTAESETPKFGAAMPTPPSGETPPTLRFDDVEMSLRSIYVPKRQ